MGRDTCRGTVCPDKAVDGRTVAEWDHKGLEDLFRSQCSHGDGRDEVGSRVPRVVTTTVGVSRQDGRTGSDGPETGEVDLVVPKGTTCLDCSFGLT